jgi:hypothetical protein
MKAMTGKAWWLNRIANVSHGALSRVVHRG